jgi:hypothetical protein
MVMGAALIALRFWLDPWFDGGTGSKFAALALLCFGGLGVYAIAAFLLGATSAKELKEQFARERIAAPPPGTA